MTTEALINPALAAVFSSATPIYVPNTSFYMSNNTESQFALAITGGYRGRFALPGRSEGGTAADGYRAADGVYIGANFHYLHGFDYEHFETNARLDTNAQGLLIVDPSKGVPVTITRNHATTGHGFAIDAGVAAVAGPWEVGFGVNGIANRITWTEAERTNYVLNSLFTGGEFVDLPTAPVSDIRVELPVDYRANAAYNRGPGTVITEYEHGFKARPSALVTNSARAASSCAAAVAMSRTDGNPPAVSASISLVPSAWMSARSGRAQISNGIAISASAFRCGSCPAEFTSVVRPGRKPGARRRSDCSTRTTPSAMCMVSSVVRDAPAPWSEVVECLAMMRTWSDAEASSGVTPS